MRSLQGSIADMDTFFDVHPIQKNAGFSWNGIFFQLVQTIHVVDGFSFMPSYGLLFDYNGKTIFITTDTQHCPHQIIDFYNSSDLIFHDCETTPYKSGVHANYIDMAKDLSDENKSKMWLYHYNQGELPDAEKDGFKGFVKKGQSFDLGDIQSYE